MPRLKAKLEAKDELQVENEQLMAKMEKLRLQTSQQQARIAKLEAEVAHLHGKAPAPGAQPLTFAHNPAIALIACSNLTQQFSGGVATLMLLCRQGCVGGVNPMHAVSHVGGQQPSVWVMLG